MKYRRRKAMHGERTSYKPFLERGIPQPGIRIPATTLHRFWTMLASTFVARVIQPWSENLRKRQVKSPKAYIADSGLLHTLLGLRTREELLGHPKVGASWEGFLLTAVIDIPGLRRNEYYFWAVHSGTELDLLVMRGQRRYGFEFKRTTTPKLTRSMRSAPDDLGLEQLMVVHAGPDSIPLGKKARAVSAASLLDELARLDVA